MPESLPTIGTLAQLACEWEVLARKVGNVCPGHEFPDLTVDDFLKSAAAIAPILDDAPHHPLGLTVLRCIEATRRVVRTNTNLGIVLLLAPLAAVPHDEELKPGVAKVLERTTVEDSRNVYAAIRLARPGGLGVVAEQDITTEPTLPLRDVMKLAKHDWVASQYWSDFGILFSINFHLLKYARRRDNLEQALIDFQFWTMGVFPDTLIGRKLGMGKANEVRLRASSMFQRCDFGAREGRQEFLDFDAWLRSDNHARNPGTTADLIAAALFVALRDGSISPATPFAWQDHPFRA